MSSALSKRKPNCPPRVHFASLIREVMPQSVREDSQSPKSRVHFVKIFDLVVKVPFDCGVELHLTGALQENFYKERQKVEVLLCRWQREWIDLEIARFEAHSHVRTIKQMSEAFEAPTKVKDERVGLIFL